MKTEFRNRAFLPIALPLMIIGGMLATIGLFGWMLLYNTKDGALALAVVLSIGILTAMSLAASQEKLDARRKAGVILALAAPMLLGVGLAGTGGGVEDEALLNINREPHVLVPELHVTVVATNSQEFEQQTLTLPANEQVAIVFDNEEVGVPHNVAYALAAPGPEAPSPLEAIDASPILAGPASSFLAFTADPGQYWFWCQVHPNMNGVLDVAEGAEPAAA